MNTTQFNSVVDTVQAVIALCGESAVMDILEINGQRCPAIFLTKFAFEKMAKGRQLYSVGFDGRPAQLIALAGVTLWHVEQAEANQLDDEQPAVAEAATDESVLCGEDHSDDDTVLSGEIPASDSDAAVVESSL